MTSEEKKEAKRLYDIEYRKNNKEKRKQQQKAWAKANPEKVKASRERNKEGKKISDKKYAEANKDKVNKIKKAWAKVNPDKVKKAKADYVKKRIGEDPLYKLKHHIGCLIRQSIKRNGYTKRSRTYDILGCSFIEFKQYIESQWEDWMTWDNYGKYNGEYGYGWDIDHIKPSSSAVNENEAIQLNHFTNLQPLCSKVNRDIKRDLWS